MQGLPRASNTFLGFIRPLKAFSQAMKKFNEQRRVLKRQTKDKAKLAQAARESLPGAWLQLARWKLTLPGVGRCASENSASYECPNPRCHDADCRCVKLSMGRCDSSKRKAVDELLAKTKRKATTVYFQSSECKEVYNCIRFTLVPHLKYPFPLPALVAFVRKFQEMDKPNCQALRKDLGLARGAALDVLFNWLMLQEALLGYKLMQKLKLRGKAECKWLQTRCC